MRHGVTIVASAENTCEIKVDANVPARFPEVISVGSSTAEPGNGRVTRKTLHPQTCHLGTIMKATNRVIVSHVITSQCLTPYNQKPYHVLVLHVTHLQQSGTPSATGVSNERKIFSKWQKY